MDTRATSEPAERLRVETERLRALVASLGLGVLVEDEARRVLLANQTFCEFFRVPASPADLVGADCADAARASTALVQEPDAFLSRIDEVLAQRVAVAGDVISFRDGRVLERDYTPIAVDSVGRGHVWVYRDVTRARHEAEFLRAAEVRDQLRLAVDTIPGLVFSARPDGYVDFVNQRWCDYAGLSREQAIGSGWEVAVPPSDLPALRERWRSILASERPGELEMRLRRFDGECRWFSTRAVPLHDGSGKLTKWYGQSTDIDDRKRAEALLAGEKRLLELLARGGTLPVVLETLCRVVEDNAADCRCGVVLVDVSGTRLEHAAGPSLPDEYNRWIEGREVDPTSGPCAMAVALKTQVIAADIAADHRFGPSGWRAMATSHGFRSCWSTPFLSVDERVLGAFAIYSNNPGYPTALHGEVIEQFTHLASVIVARKRSEDALQRAQAELSHVTRVTSLGELAASIAHELNQPLAGIGLNASACLRWLASKTPNLEEARQAATRISRDAARASDVISRLRALFKKSTLVKELLNVNDTVTEVVTLMRSDIQRHDIRLRLELGAELPQVFGDRVQLQQVLLNLIRNAIESMSDVAGTGRELVIHSQHRTPDRVQVAVQDSGVGLDPRIASRIFDPFYTSKPAGMGMGLSISRSIVESHGGELSVLANDGPGVTFFFSIPCR